MGDTVSRYAYIHKKNTERFGLLEAVNYRDARRHLGSGFRIRRVLLTRDQELELHANGSLQDYVAKAMQ